MRTFRTATTTAASGLLVAGTLLIAGPANAQPDLDCENFDYQEQAQALYDSYPSGLQMLDDDDDGIACEALPSDPEGREWVVLEHTDDVVDLAELIAANDECSDFTTQQEAQFVLDEDTSDPRDLDEDGDGIACESEFETTSTPPTEEEEPQVVAPEGGVDAGGSGTTGVENTGLLAAGGLALVVGAGGLILARRQDAGA